MQPRNTLLFTSHLLNTHWMDWVALSLYMQCSKLQAGLQFWCPFLSYHILTNKSPYVCDSACILWTQYKGIIAYFYSSDQLLVNKAALGVTELHLLHELTKFENLSPCYSATVPPCWTEMMQAQKQRRHPQHLQQGDEIQHTRSWRLQNDAWVLMLCYCVWILSFCNGRLGRGWHVPISVRHVHSPMFSLCLLQ